MAGTSDISIEGIIGKSLRRPKFVVPILRNNLDAQIMTLPDQFVTKFGEAIPSMVKLYFPNGDIIGCQYCGRTKSLIGITNIFKRYSVQTYSLFCFEYISICDFYVTIIGGAAVEIEYPTDKHYISHGTDYFNHLCSSQMNRQYADNAVEDDLNATLLELNAKGGGDPEIELLISNSEVEVVDKELNPVDRSKVPSSYWFNNCSVYLSARNHGWKVLVHKIGNASRFGDGWQEFVTATGIENGDLVVLSERGNPFHFEVSIFRDCIGIQQTVRQGCYSPAQFVRFLNEDLILNGQLFVPRLLWQKYKIEMDTSLELNVDGGSQYQINYCPLNKRLYGLHKFVAESNVKQASMLIFRYVTNDTLSVTIYSKRRVDMNLADFVYRG